MGHHSAVACMFKKKKLRISLKTAHLNSLSKYIHGTHSIFDTIYIKCFLTVSIIVWNILESTIFNQPKSLS